MNSNGLLQPINRYVPDEATHLTSFGRHNRLIPAYSRKDQELVVREDLQGLALATVLDCLRVACDPRSRSLPRGLQLAHIETIPGPGCNWFIFKTSESAA